MRLIAGPTPLHRLVHFEEATGCGELWIKRDDLTGFGLAGNKARALEKLLDDAKAQDANLFITGGHAGSNFMAAAAQACATIAMPCHVVISDWEETLSLRLAAKAGAHLSAAEDVDLDEAVSLRADELMERGARAYVVPQGGSCGIGALGVADAVHELTRQLKSARINPGRVVMAVGTGGSLAGMCVGAAEVGANWTPYGVCVSDSTAKMAEIIVEIGQNCADLRGITRPIAEPVLRDATYPRGVLDDEEQAATELAFHLEGILLDTTYTAKAFTAAVGLARTEPGPTVFWHTGGVSGALDVLPEPGPVEKFVQPAGQSPQTGEASP